MKRYFSSLKGLITRNDVLVQNFSFLSLLQVFNLLAPLITYPFLIRVLGKETYGLVVFAQAIIGYLLILVSFGFNISATKEISIHRDNKEKLDEIVSSVLLIKIILFLFSFAVLGLFLIFLKRVEGFELLLLLSMTACIGDIIFPIWYFQGIEKMKYITLITVIIRLIILTLIFVLISRPRDYLWVPAINGFGYLIAGFISLVIIFYKHKIQFHFQPLRILKYYFRDSLPLFVSNLSISLYLSTNKVITGAFLGMQEVAYYDLAEKLTTFLKLPQSVLSQSLFPKISRERNSGFVKRIFRFSMVFNLGLLLLLLLFSKSIILVLGGEPMLPSRSVVCLLALTVPVIAMSNIFGFQILVPFGYSKAFSRVVITSGLFYLLQLLFLWLTVGFSIISITLVALNTEIFVTAYLFYYCKKYKLW